MKDYYRAKELFIKRSLHSLFPATCTQDWLQKLTGRSELSWDSETLQVAFLDPINNQSAARSKYYYGLGCVLMLESLDINPDEYLPLIAISEAFESCFRIFDQIPIYSQVNPAQGLDIDDGIKANVGVALLTMPFYPIIHNQSCFNDEKKLWLFRNVTRSVSRVLYANGTNLYRKKTKTYVKSFEEYAQNSFYLNSPKLQFNADLWLCFSDLYDVASAVGSWEELIRLFSLSNQLLTDLRHFKTWIKENANDTANGFEGHNNFVLLHLSDALTTQKLFEGPLTSARLRSLFRKAHTETKISDMIAKSITRVGEIVESLPVHSDFKYKMIDYVQLILDDKRKKE